MSAFAVWSPYSSPALLGWNRFSLCFVLHDLHTVLQVGIDLLVASCIMSCDPNLWAAMFKNIVLIGPTAVAVGLGDRLKLELTRYNPCYALCQRV